MPAEILILGFTEYHQRMLSDYLSATDYRCRFFKDADPFFFALSNDTPQLIILDVNLSSEIVYAVIGRVKNALPTRHIPVIGISNENEAVLALDAGADSFLRFPVGQAEFLARVRSLLRRLPEFYQITP
ncbi:hypothetical protein LJC27_01385 [Christensenellaceae bacterium OttesenSCG-928-M15]|nr:hypothetical protein [Christensenellaceae bacterium OttesenSCG-928-M15]